jgi:hypothetical protein
MPTRQNHVKRAKANIATLEGLPNDDYAWRVTLRFYAVLHLLDAVFDSVDYAHPSNHEERYNLLLQKRYAVPHLIQQAYRQLEQQSREARYDCPSLGRLESLDTRSTDNFLELLEFFQDRLGLLQA